jgi:hypothetical protein
VRRWAEVAADVALNAVSSATATNATERGLAVLTSGDIVHLQQATTGRR